MMKLSPIIVSLLDTDLYKFNMNQVMFHKHTNLNGVYMFKCRNKDVFFTQEMVDEINAQIDHLCTLTFTDEELNYLGSLRFIKSDYIEFLRLWRPLRRYVSCWLNELSGQLFIEVTGPLFSAMQFEIYLLEIVGSLGSRPESVCSVICRIGNIADCPRAFLIARPIHLLNLNPEEARKPMNRLCKEFNKRLQIRHDCR